MAFRQKVRQASHLLIFYNYLLIIYNESVISQRGVCIENYY